MTDFSEPCPTCKGHGWLPPQEAPYVKPCYCPDCHEGRVPAQWAVDRLKPWVGGHEGRARNALLDVMRAAP